ncbi:MAG: ferredoxin--NADP reductase [Deltaproteobacteria bacterium]|nr:ferredoxin--NADP reductase [Deltaproteobacteria bacterium]
MQTEIKRREVGWMDVLAAAIARVTPRVVHPVIDQARHDVRRVITTLRVDNTRPFRLTTDGPAEVPLSLDEIAVLRAVLPEGLAVRLETIARDAQVIAAPLLGGPREPVVVSLVRPARAPAVSAITTRTVRVMAVRRETADATTFELEDDAGRAFDFVSGQFVTLVLSIEGQELRRAYSVSSVREGLPRFAITVKRVRDGVVSNYLNDVIAEGDTLEVLGPSGSFVLREDGAERPLWFFAGGSGITPIYSMICAQLREPTGPVVHLVYANRDRDSVIFAEAIDALAREHADRLRVHHVLEHTDDATACVAVGRLDAATCESVCEALGIETDARVYVCGPEPMMQAARGVLLARGIAERSLFEEKFASPQKRVALSDVAQRARGGHEVLVVLRGREHRVQTAVDQTVLEAALSAGLDMPFSCTMGGCGACKLKLVDGTVEMVEPNCLNDAERRDGDILACVSCTTSDVRVEVPV